MTTHYLESLESLSKSAKIIVMTFCVGQSENSSSNKIAFIFFNYMLNTIYYAVSNKLIER
jgi:hypothetical protein